MPVIKKQKKLLKDNRDESTINLEKKLIEKNLLKKRELSEKTFLNEIKNFFESLFRAIVEVAITKNITIFVNAFFIDLIEAYPSFFNPLKNKITAGNISGIPEEYITRGMSISVISFFVVFIIEFAKNILNPVFSFKSLIFDLALIPLLSVIVVGAILYFLPFAIASKRKKSIESNMPFAINHMAAIASAGVPPEIAFRMLVEYGSYGEFSKEISKIIKRTDTFGENLNKAIIFVIKNTPSEKFKEFLYGMVSVLEGGGNINEYLDEMANVALFDYQLKRKQYLSTLSTFGDIYTVMLIAAPLFVIALLTIMNLIPSAQIMGMNIVSLMNITTYGFIPIFNIAFLIFLYIFQPEI